MIRARHGTGVAAAALCAFLLWRVRLGADVGDGTHVVALAMRMAQGDTVLVDEMNLQALGSLAAVPFVWAWLQLFGVEAIVLASRVFYVVLALAAGLVGYRALRTRLPEVAAFTAVALMLVPTPYNLLVTSYNSMPVLALGVSFCAGFAAVSVGSGRWAAVSGVALAVAVLSHPSSLPAAAVLGLTLLVLGWRRPGVARGLVLGGGGASLLVLVLLALGPGLSAVLETVAYTTDYQSSRLNPWERLDRAVRRYLDGLFAWRHLPAALLAALALLPFVPWRLRVLPAMGVPVAVAVAAWVVVPPTIINREPFGLTSGAHVLLVVPLLLVPVALWAHRTARAEVRLLLTVSLPLAVVGFVSFSMVTSAGVPWGVAVPPVLPLYGTLGAGLVLWAGRHGPRLLAATAALAVVGSLLVVHPLRTFMNPDPRQLVGTVPEGPLAGLRTDATYLEVDCELRSIAAEWIGPDDSVFFYARSGGYAYSTAAMDTNIVWISDFGDANRWTVEWWERTGRWPDVAVVYPAAVRQAGGWDQLALEDPLIAALDRMYGSPVEAHGHLLLRRDGTVPDSLREVPVGCTGTEPEREPSQD